MSYETERLLNKVVLELEKQSEILKGIEASLEVMTKLLESIDNGVHRE
jgi:hypothetical protein